MTFEKLLRSISTAASQMLGILRKSCRVFHYILLLGRCFRGFVLPVSEYWFLVWCSTAYTHINYGQCSRWCQFVNLGWLWVKHCTSSICGSVMYAEQIMWNPMHPRGGSIPGPYVPVRVTRDVFSLMITPMRHLAAETPSPAGLLFPCQYLWGTITVTPYSMVLDWRVSRTGPMNFYWPTCSLHFCFLLFSLSFLSFYELVLLGWGLRIGMVLIAFSQPIGIANIF